MDYNWIIVYFAPMFFSELSVKDIFNLIILNKEINKEYSKDIYWKTKYREVFSPNILSERLGYKSTIKLVVNSSKLCCICLKSLWTVPLQTNYLHICDCNFPGLFLRGHVNCTEKFLINKKTTDEIKSIKCPFCSRNTIVIPIKITS